MRSRSKTEGSRKMEYGEAINNGAAAQALSIAVALLDEGQRDLHQIAVLAVASSYCACVTDGEDAAESRLSSIHANLIDQVERRLTILATQKEKS